MDGLIELIGGKKAFVEKLNNTFELAQKHDFTSAKSHDKGEQAANRRKYLNYGNQPSMQTAYLFNYADAPHLTQYWSRQVIEKVYSGISPDYGYSGDEDQGLMGSLAVIMKMGLFSMRGGAALEPTYDLGSPIFNKITIHLDEKYYPGNQFVIEAKNNSSENLYVKSAVLNGNALNQPFFYHKDLVKGGKLVLEMDKTPSKN